MSTVADKLIQRRKDANMASGTLKASGGAMKAGVNGDDEVDLAGSVWLWNWLDFDRKSNVTWLVIFRVVQACTLTWNLAHPDQLWQGTQAAYHWVYGGVYLPWEWSPEYQLRNAVYPAYLAGPLYVLKLTGLDTRWAVLV